MKLKAIAIALGVASAVSFANADVNSQLSSLQAQVNQLQSQVGSMGSSSAAGVVGVNSTLSNQMMSNQSGVGKELNLLQNNLSVPVTVGGFVQADAVYDHSSPNGNFINPAINAAGITSDSATRLLLSNVSLATTAKMGSWVTGYIQAGKSNVGESTASSSFGIQDAYLVLGNLSQMPVYGFVGDKDIDFGSFATVDMYNAPLTRELFQARGATAGVGVNAYGFNGTLSLMNGGAMSTSPVSVNSVTQYSNLNTINNSSINNYALNLNYGMTNGAFAWNLGVGYLAGSAFVQQNTNSSGQNKTNGAWDINGKVSAMGFDLLGEYDTTANKTDLASGSAAQRAQAWDIGADYNFPVMGYKSVVNADYSGASLSGNSADKQSQYVIGYRVSPVNNVWAGLEYAYTKGGVTLGTNQNKNPVDLNFPSNVSNSTVALDLTAAF